MADLRMPDLNKVFLAGNLTRAPELKYIASGTAVCSLGLAVSRKWRTKDGEQKEDTVFVKVTTWGKTAEYCGEHLTQGRPVMVEGRLTYSQWESSTGEKRSAVEVTADRVQQLSWEDTGEKPVPRENYEPGPTAKPLPEKEIPF